MRWWPVTWATYWRILRNQTLGMIACLVALWWLGPLLSFKDMASIALLNGALISLYCELRHKESEES